MINNSLVDEAVSIYGNDREALLPILQHIQDYSQYLDRSTLAEVASCLDIAPTKVFSVASFYHYLHTSPVGRYRIYVCKTISCHMAGGKSVLKKIGEILRIGVGEMTEDQLFSIHQTSCLGQCDNGPAMMINDLPFTHLTEEKVQFILDDYRRNEGRNAIVKEFQS